jgi:hypothetical protein
MADVAPGGLLIQSTAVLAIALGSLLVALALSWLEERRGVPPGDVPYVRAEGRRGLAWLLAAVTLANLPLLLAAPHVVGAVLPPDAYSHAGVAQALSREGLPHGWIDVYGGGFPFGIHYQSLSLLLDAGLITLGVPAMAATHALGLAALLAAPLAFAWATHRCGVHPLASLAGAIVLTAVAPEHPMVGGWDAYVRQGLLSQVVTIPILLVCGGCVVSGAASRALPWLAALAVAAHTQVTVVAFAAALPAVLAAGTRDVRRRFVVASVAAAIAALALYGTGALTFAVPFSYPTNSAPYRIVGFALDRLADGDFLDAGRAPVLTAAGLGSAALLLPLARGRVARGALGLVATATLVTFGRDVYVREAGRLQPLIELLPPGRMMVVVPLAVALSTAVALHELDARVRRIATPGCLARSGPVPLAVGVTALSLLTLPERAAWMHTVVTRFAAMSGAYECGPKTPEGYSTAVATAWVQGLSRGRFVTDLASFPDTCPAEHGLDLASPVPLGYDVGGPGAQVGVLMRAYSTLSLASPASAARAEVLGVRDVLAVRSQVPEALNDEGWRVRESRGDTLLLERTSGGDFFGVGCVVEEWTGADRKLRDALVSDLDDNAPWRSEPASLVALTAGAGPVERRAVDRGACDASAASVVETPREPGAYEGVVTSPHEVDVVVRATYFATWQVTVDGAPVAKRRVAPGFVSARVPAGTHRVEAVVALPRGSIALPVVACLLLVMLGARGATRRAPRVP